ncbi:MOSC domain-containing protein [Oleiharenicola lentus]|uniref:MOSC domain-containing protein n=1 Tax=Oleiharenicola lentus TaxID=2508720 RepID=UPI003F670747
MKIEAIYISPGHNFFGHHGKPPSKNPTLSVAEVECVAGHGLKGDRFFDYKPGYGGQITFFAREIHDALCRDFRVIGVSSEVYRRNVVTSGVNLNDLIGQEFSVQGIRFFGYSECKPCYWMDQAVAPGAFEWLKGNGGLRARILSDGILRTEAGA